MALLPESFLARADVSGIAWAYLPNIVRYFNTARIPYWIWSKRFWICSMGYCSQLFVIQSVLSTAPVSNPAFAPATLATLDRRAKITSPVSKLFCNLSQWVKKPIY